MVSSSALSNGRQPDRCNCSNLLIDLVPGGSPNYRPVARGPRTLPSQGLWKGRVAGERTGVGVLTWGRSVFNKYDGN